MMMTASSSTAGRAALLLAIHVAGGASIAAGCRRALPAATEDASSAPGPADAAATLDGPAPDVPLLADASTPPPDAGASCAANAPTLDVCGCGCCGNPINRSCYYPALGESVSTIPNPMPPPTINCNLAGCSAGVHYVCCADPGTPAAATATYCLRITRGAQLGYAVMKRVGETCTSIDVGALADRPAAITAPDGLPVSGDRRAPCDSTAQAVLTIGGLGSITGGVGGGMTLDVHAVLFFEGASGIESERFDVDHLDVLCP